MAHPFITYFQQPQPHESSSFNVLLSGGKNSSVGKEILSKSSQGLSSFVPQLHSFWGTQKSYAGIKSITRRSKRTIEKIPSDT